MSRSARSTRRVSSTGERPCRRVVWPAPLGVPRPSARVGSKAHIAPAHLLSTLISEQPAFKRMTDDQWETWIAAGERTSADQRDRQDAYRRQHPTPVSATHPRVVPLQRAIVWGGITDDAIKEAELLRSPWLHLVTADLGAWDRDADQLNRLREIGPLEPWCDCRVEGGTHPQAAIDLARDLGTGWVGQAESVEELEAAVGIHRDGHLVSPAGTERAKRIIGNPNAWTAKQRETATRMIEDGDLSVSGEQYAGPYAMVTYSTQGVPVDSITLGVAMDGGIYHDLGVLLERLRERADAEKFERTVLLWHGAGLRGEAWEAARTL